MPVELSLPFVAAVGTDLLDAEWELFEDVIKETDRVLLGMSVVCPQGADPSRIINGSILVSLDPSSGIRLECQELDIELDMMAWYLFGVSLSMDLSPAGVPGQAPETIPDESPIYTVAANLDPVVALQVPHYSLGAEVIFLPKMQYQFDGFFGQLIGPMLANWPFALQAC